MTIESLGPDSLLHELKEKNIRAAVENRIDAESLNEMVSILKRYYLHDKLENRILYIEAAFNNTPDVYEAVKQFEMLCKRNAARGKDQIKKEPVQLLQQPPGTPNRGREASPSPKPFEGTHTKFVFNTDQRYELTDDISVLTDELTSPAIPDSYNILARRIGMFIVDKAAAAKRSLNGDEGKDEITSANNDSPSGRLFNDPLSKGLMIEGKDGAYSVRLDTERSPKGVTNFGVVGGPVVVQGSLHQQEILVNRLFMGEYVKKEREPRDAKGAPVSRVLVMCEPFVEGGDEGESLIRSIEEKDWDVLILIGPFAQAGRVADTITESWLVSKLAGLASMFPNRKLVLVAGPSCELCESAYPQNKMSLKGLKARNVIVCGNPCTIMLGNTMVAISNSSFNNNAEIISLETMQMADVMKRRFEQICESILVTDIFYPIFPAYLIHPVNYDRVLARRVGSPDVLILPSRCPVKTFVLNKTVCVNPGFVSMNFMTWLRVVDGELVVESETVK